MKNHELLGRKWEYNKSVSDLIAKRRSVDPKSFYMPSAQGRAHQIEQTLFFPALRHLGFPPRTLDGFQTQICSDLR